jgi:sec-independent protein translocase protein TatA
MIVGNIASPEVLIILVIAVALLFGANRLPKLARSVGEASKEFKRSQQEAEDEARAKEAAKANPPADDDKITLSKSELDALLAEREAKARRDAETPPSN